MPGAPGRGIILAAIAVTAFATGPCMLAILALGNILFDYGPPFLSRITFDEVPALVGFFSAAALVGSIPAACFNAYVLHHAAYSGRDSVWYSLLSGALAGAIVLILLALMSGVPLSRRPAAIMIFLAWCSSAGACMGLLHWLIAIRPRRKWRKRLIYDVDAIRAME